MMNSEIYEKIKQMLEERNPYAEIDRETKLLEEKILDSMAIFAFVTDLEDVFDIEIPDDAITKSNFMTLESIVSLVLEFGGE